MSDITWTPEAERAYADGYCDGLADQADLEALTVAARAVVDAWPGGDLAGAVHALAELVGVADA